MSSIVCKKHAHCETTLPLKDRWREPKQQINARGPNICSQQKTWRVHFKQGILNGIVTGMRFMLAGVDSQERRILQCQEKKVCHGFLWLHTWRNTQNMPEKFCHRVARKCVLIQKWPTSRQTPVESDLQSEFYRDVSWIFLQKQSSHVFEGRISQAMQRTGSAGCWVLSAPTSTTPILGSLHL